MWLLYKLSLQGPTRYPPLTGLSVNYYCQCKGRYYRFKRGDRVTIIRYEGVAGVVDSAVFQRTFDYPDEYAPGSQFVLDTGEVVAIRWDQLAG